MRPGPVLLMIALPSAVMAAEPLPLRHGLYVQQGTPCADPPFAAMHSYDGIGLGDPHSHACRIRIVARHGQRYLVRNSCIDAGTGPAPRSTERLLLTLSSPTRFVIGGTTFRWCPGTGD